MQFYIQCYLKLLFTRLFIRKISVMFLQILKIRMILVTLWNNLYKLYYLRSFTYFIRINQSSNNLHQTCKAGSGVIVLWLIEIFNDMKFSFKMKNNFPLKKSNSYSTQLCATAHVTYRTLNHKNLNDYFNNVNLMNYFWLVLKLLIINHCSLKLAKIGSIFILLLISAIFHTT